MAWFEDEISVTGGGGWSAAAEFDFGAHYVDLEVISCADNDKVEVSIEGSTSADVTLGPPGDREIVASLEFETGLPNSVQARCDSDAVVKVRARS